jgi:hypothetical protein
MLTSFWGASNLRLFSGFINSLLVARPGNRGFQVTTKALNRNDLILRLFKLTPF